MVTLNADASPIQNYELKSNGLLLTWGALGIANTPLVYPDRTEIILPEGLFNEDSIKTAIAIPYCYKHPPRALNAKNYKKYAVGTTLQEWNQDGDRLVIASMFWDEEVIQGILDKKIKYTSAGYYPKKVLNADGTYTQTFRVYDHNAVLPEDYAPRAGAKCQILNLDDSSDMETEDTQNHTLQTDIQERVELWSDWKPVIEQNNKTVDFNLDSRGIKRLVLSCFYPEKTVKALKDDLVLDGFWLNFEANKDQIFEAAEERSYQEAYASGNTHNADSKQLSALEQYIKTIEGR